jgi:hypothetical protein
MSDYTPAPIHEPEPTLEELVEFIVQCDDTFCPELASAYGALTDVIMQERFSTHMASFNSCVNKKGETHPDCQLIFRGGIQRASSIISGLLNHQRMKASSDPLINYQGNNYLHPWWFTGVGEIWRRTANGSRHTTVRNCQLLMRNSEQCFGDKEKVKDGTCFRLYSEAFGCEAGTNCSFLQKSILACVNRPDLAIRSDYEEMQLCMKDIPSFSECVIQPQEFTYQLAQELDVPFNGV